MNFAVIGCGGAGSAIIIQLAKMSSTSKLLLLDFDKNKSDAVADLVNKVNPQIKCESVGVNARDVKMVEELVRGCSVVINAASPEFNIPIMTACLNAKTNYLDLASNPFEAEDGLSATLSEQLKLDQEFKKLNLIAISNTGFSPGFTDILVKAITEKKELTSIESIKVYFGEIIKSSKLATSWSPQILLSEVIAPPTIYLDGEIKELDMADSVEEYDFPKIGKMAVRPFNAHPELKTIPDFMAIPIKKLVIGGECFLTN